MIVDPDGKARSNDLGVWLIPVDLIPIVPVNSPAREGQVITIWFDRRAVYTQYIGPTWKAHHKVFYERLAYDALHIYAEVQAVDGSYSDVFGVWLKDVPARQRVPAPAVKAEINPSDWK